MEPVISIKNISKKYRITHKKVRYAALRDIITYALMSPFTYFKNRAKKLFGRDTKEEFWALKDVNLDIYKGEVVGIIGKNGAGKSTLLKILTGITPPTTGEIVIKGKVASLLEVGTGFHPELTGRVNIFLNGAILGMGRKEIREKFDQIVEFSGIERFIDTPVKRYSSGMYVRLAFSVAAHLEPDILLVDEVLAVGDMEFQKKCLGKMDEVTRTRGRTILFVSHNMDAVSRLCKTSILLDQGKVVAIGKTDEIIGKYVHQMQHGDTSLTLPITDEEITLHDFSVTQNGKNAHDIAGENSFAVNLDFSVHKKLRSFRSGFFLKNAMGTVVSRTFTQDWDPTLEDIETGRYKTHLTIPARLLIAGQYEIEVKLFCLGTREYLKNHLIEKRITVFSPKDYNESRSKNTDRVGYFLIPEKWTVEREIKTNV